MCLRVSFVFVLSILFWFPQCTHYFWRVFRFPFMENKQDYSVTSVKDVKVCFWRRKYQKQWTYLLNHTFCNAKNLLHLQSSWKKIQKGYIKFNFAVHCGFSTKKNPSKVNTILKVVIFKHSVILFRCSDLVDGQNYEILKPAISGFYIHFHPVYRPCYYFTRKQMTPIYWQQKLPDNREYIKIQEWL